MEAGEPPRAAAEELMMRELDPELLERPFAALVPGASDHLEREGLHVAGHVGSVLHGVVHGEGSLTNPFDSFAVKTVHTITGAWQVAMHMNT